MDENDRAVYEEIMRRIDEKVRIAEELRAGLRQPDPDQKRIISLEAIYRAHPSLRPDNS